MKIRRKESDFKNDFMEVLNNNANLITVSAVALIVISGISIINNPANWFVPVISVLVLISLLFLFMNHRVFIKATVVFLMNIFFASIAFQTGMLLDAYHGGGFLWMSQILFSLFALLSYSYLTISGRSRWGTLAVSTITTFATTYIFGISGLGMPWSTLIGLIVGVVFFVFFYKYTGKTRYKKNTMPLNTVSKKLSVDLVKNFEELGWNATFIKTNNKKDDKNDLLHGNFLVWKDKAYVLYPVVMDRAFSDVGYKTRKIGYKGKNINPWLINIFFKSIPLWKSKGADIGLVLLDMRAENGKDNKVIGASLPDTKKKLPIGIFPTKDIAGNIKKVDDLITSLDAEMSIYVDNLTDKQKKSIARIGIIDEEDEKMTEKQ